MRVYSPTSHLERYSEVTCAGYISNILSTNVLGELRRAVGLGHGAFVDVLDSNGGKMLSNQNIFAVRKKGKLEQSKAAQVLWGP